MNTYRISIEGAGNGVRTAKGKNLQSAFASLGYTGFKVNGMKIHIPGAPGHESNYYARIIAGVHNGHKFNDEEIKEGDLVVNTENKKAKAIPIIKAENGVLVLDLLAVNPRSWFGTSPLREKHKKVVK
jgi:hypothetical protein